MDEPKKPVSLQVHIPEHLRAAISTNVIRVTTTTQGDVLIDFVFAHPQDIDENGNQAGTLVSRIEMPVQVAKDLEAILESKIGKAKKE
jgi:hypothetical protein